MKKIVCIIMLLLSLNSLLLSVGFSFDAAAQGDYWVWVRDAVTGAYGEAVAGDGYAVYIAKGKGFYRYTPSDNSFVELASPPAPDGYAFKTGAALCWELFGDYIYALYGAASGDSRRYFYRYNIRLDSWERLADTPYDQGEGDAITWVRSERRIYATVGGEQRPTRFLYYDPAANVWSDAPTDPPAGMGDGASLAWTGGDYIYALRGEYYEESPIYDFWRYSISSNDWASMADIPAYPHDGGVGGVGDGGSLIYTGFWMENQSDYVYALSGNQAHPEKPAIPDKRFYRYTISTNSWERLADLPFGVGYYVGCRLAYADGHIYAWQGAPSTWEGGGDDLARYEFPQPPIVEVPKFKLLNKSLMCFEGGANITLTLKNCGATATEGTVWMPWTKLYYNVEFVGSPPSGSLSESLLTFDGNGDGDISDVFQVVYVNNETVLVDGTEAKAMMSPKRRVYYNDDSRAFYDIMEKTNFTIGTKTHTLYRTVYFTQYNIGYAEIGLDSFFKYHPAPNMFFGIEHIGTSINSSSTAEIINVEANGSASRADFYWVSPWLDTWEGGWQWWIDKMYVYPLSPIESGASFTIAITIKGEPGSYMLVTTLNWSPDSEHRYRYVIFDAVETLFAIIGTVHRHVDFENQTFPIDVATNSTISENILFNPEEKAITLNASGYTDYGGSTYFWNVSIPKKLLTGEPWTVTLDENPLPYTSTSNKTHTFIYFNYTFTQPYYQTSKISIKGTQIMPTPQLQYFLEISHTVGGITNPPPGNYTYVNGTAVSVTAIPSKGYSFSYWLFDGEKRTENPITILIDANHTLKAQFVDDMPPEIGEPIQNPSPDNVQPFQKVTVRVNVTDYGTGIRNVTLWYSINNGTSWTMLNMSELVTILSHAEVTYGATIPGYENCTWITYKIIAYDNAGNKATKDNNGYGYKYHVIPEFPSCIIMSLLMLLSSIAIVSLKENQ